MRRNILITTSLLLLGTASFATTLVDQTQSFISEEDAASRAPSTIEDQNLYGGGISQEDFNDVIDYHKGKYNDTIRSYGVSWSIAKKWTDNTKNANASKQGSNWHINMYGGLARDDNFTKDGFALVLCHETGHLLAGFPAYSRGGSSRKGMMGNEGNSDYYATYACAHFLWDDKKEENAEAAKSVDSVAKAFCDKALEGEDARNLCYRNLNGARGLAKFLNRNQPVYYDKPDNNKVSRTSDPHPRGQCRLDTYMAGAVCGKYASWKHEAYPANEREMRAQSCSEASGKYPGDAEAVKAAGMRPRCWYAPAR
jgi:hypothetical protein